MLGVPRGGSQAVSGGGPGLDSRERTGTVEPPQHVGVSSLAVVLNQQLLRRMTSILICVF